MKEYIIEIEIDVDGTLHAVTKGMQGKICVEELDSILAGIEGGREIKNTGDYYKKSSAKQTIKIGGKRHE